ncbi:MAG: DegV family protein [Lachnospiraceae bacterium]|nr:DegV family protein [Lachnospiraceae bacterium]
MARSDSFIIMTDSAGDLPYEFLEKQNVPCVDLTFLFEKAGDSYRNRDLPTKEFYRRVREGEVAKTSAANPEAFTEEFKKALDAGKDILYLGFDSAISTTVNSARIAADDILDDYPGRRILIVDSLCASAGEGLLVVETLKQYDAGKSIDECYEFAMNLKPSIAHRFTVETLTYLQRGGRVSAASAFAGNLLNIKPVLHIDDEGKLIPLAKARGRKKSLEMIADAFGATVVDPENGTIIISQADSIEDAEYLAAMLKERYNATTDMITEIGPVIGSHAGPGTIALFFIAKSRK